MTWLRRRRILVGLKCGQFGDCVSEVSVLVSELIRAANATSTTASTNVERLLARSIRWVGILRQQSNIIPIPGRDALIHVRTVAAGADRVPPEEWQYALFQAAEMLRDLSIVVESGTIISTVEV